MRILIEVFLFLIILIAAGYVATRLFQGYFNRDESKGEKHVDRKEE